MRQIAKIIDKLTELRRRPNVSPKEDIATWLDLPEETGRFGIKLDSGHTNKQELT
jgi:hypothetical protein